MAQSETKFRVFSKAFESNKMFYDIEMMIKNDGIWWMCDNQKRIFQTDSNRNFLMQYLGLKDRKGKEICEGDLVRQGDTLFEVKKCDGGYELQIWREMKKGGAIEGSVYNISALSEIYCEIVGNIYENPEILN